MNVGKKVFNELQHILYIDHAAELINDRMGNNLLILVSAAACIYRNQRKRKLILCILYLGYLLSNKVGNTNSPERPLSDLGLLGYRNHWENVIFRQLENQIGPISIEGKNITLSLENIEKHIHNYYYFSVTSAQKGYHPVELYQYNSINLMSSIKYSCYNDTNTRMNGRNGQDYQG